MKVLRKVSLEDQNAAPARNERIEFMADLVDEHGAQQARSHHARLRELTRI